MSTINEFPWQEPILGALSDGSPRTLDELADHVAGDDPADDVRDAVEADVDHLVDIGLAARDGDRVSLTKDGLEAADRLP